MFKGKEINNSKARQEEMARFPKCIYVIYNPKAYTNGENLKQWARQQYKWGSAYSPSDNEPRLLTLDAFGAHKKKKTAQEIKTEKDFITELKKLNCIISMIPPGATGYIQVLDGFVNKLIKKLIQESEETYYDLHKAE